MGRVFFKILHVIRDVIYLYVSLILSETLGTRQLNALNIV